MKVRIMAQNEKNFVHPSFSDLDLKFLGFDEENILIEEHWTMAHIMHNVGIFDSVNQARKNGWNKPIPFGIWQKKVGKKRVLISIMNRDMKTWNGSPINSKEFKEWEKRG